MNDKFDELAKEMAQSVTRRGALKKFGAGLAGMVLAALGLANNTRAHLADGDLHRRSSARVFGVGIINPPFPMHNRIIFTFFLKLFMMLVV